MLDYVYLGVAVMAGSGMVWLMCTLSLPRTKAEELREIAMTRYLLF